MSDWIITSAMLEVSPDMVRFPHLSFHQERDKGFWRGHDLWRVHSIHGDSAGGLCVCLCLFEYESRHMALMAPPVARLTSFSYQLYLGLNPVVPGFSPTATMWDGSSVSFFFWSQFWPPIPICLRKGIPHFLGPGSAQPSEHSMLGAQPSSLPLGGLGWWRLVLAVHEKLGRFRVGQLGTLATIRRTFSLPQKISSCQKHVSPWVKIRTPFQDDFSLLKWHFLGFPDFPCSSSAEELLRTIRELKKLRCCQWLRSRLGEVTKPLWSGKV